MTQCAKQWRDKDKNFQATFNQLLDTVDTNNNNNFISNIQQQITEPFIATADYISADFLTQNQQQNIEIKYLNYVRLMIDVPYVEGSFPLISTKPLHNYRLLLASDSEYASQQHSCSNFVVNKAMEISSAMPHEVTSQIKYGFVQSNLNQHNQSDYEKRLQTYRQQSTLSFYSNLDENKCGWTFVAYYDISELTTQCQAQIIGKIKIYLIIIKYFFLF